MLLIRRRLFRDPMLAARRIRQKVALGRAEREKPPNLEIVVTKDYKVEQKDPSGDIAPSRLELPALDSPLSEMWIDVGSAAKLNRAARQSDTL